MEVISVKQLKHSLLVSLTLPYSYPGVHFKRFIGPFFHQKSVHCSDKGVFTLRKTKMYQEKNGTGEKCSL